MAEERVDLTLDARQALAQIAQFEARLERAGNVTLNVDTKGINRAVAETETAFRRAGAASVGVLDPARTAQAARNFDAARTSVDRTSASLSKGAAESEKLRKSTLGIGTALGAIAGIGIVRQGFQFFKGAVTDAANLVEVLNATKVVFEENAGAITRFAEGADAIGLSDVAAQKAAASFGLLLENFGLASSEVARLSVVLSERAADVGSLFNEAGEAVADTFRSALVGETEPIRRFGVDLRIAAVQAKAVELGLTGAGEEASKYAETQARIALILEKTNVAQGDFARTAATSLPNSLKVLRAEFTDVSVEVGQALLPALLDGVRLIRAEFLPAVRDAGTDLAGSLGAAIPAVVDAAVSLVEVLPTLAELFGNLVQVGTPLLELLAKIPPEILSMGIAARTATGLLGRTGLGGVLAGFGVGGPVVGGAVAGFALLTSAMGDAQEQSEKTQGVFVEALQAIASGSKSAEDAISDFATDLGGIGGGGAFAQIGAGLTSQFTDLATHLRTEFGPVENQLRVIFGPRTQQDVAALTEQIRDNDSAWQSATSATKEFFQGGLFRSEGDLAARRLGDVSRELDEINRNVTGTFFDIGKSAGVTSGILQELIDVAGGDVFKAAESFDNLQRVMQENEISVEALNLAMVSFGDTSSGVAEGGRESFQNFDQIIEAATKRQAELNEEAALSAQVFSAEFGPSLSDAAAEADNLSTSVDAARDSLNLLLGEPLAEEQQIAGIGEAIRAVTERVGEEGFAKGLNALTEAGAANVDVLADLAQRQEDYVFWLIEQGRSQDEVNAAIDSGTFALAAAAAQLGVTEEEARDLIDRYGLMPELVETQALLKDDATPTINQLRTQIIDLDKLRAEVGVSSPTGIAIGRLISDLQREANELDGRTVRLTLDIVTSAQDQAAINIITGKSDFLELREGGVIDRPTIGLIGEVPGQPEVVINPASSRQRIEHLMHEGGLYPIARDIIVKDLSKGPSAGAIGGAVGSSLRGQNRGLEERLDELIRQGRRGPKPRAL